MKLDLKNTLKKNWILLSLALFALTYYFVSLSFLDPEYRFLNNFYQTGDAQEYLVYSKWIGGSVAYCNSVRTFFYPLLLFFFNFLGGTTLIWMLQVILWLVGNCLIYKSVKSITQSKTLASFIFMFSSTTFSLIVLTLHGLTEITVFFLLACLAYCCVKLANSKTLNSKYSFYALLLFSLLAVTKPLYLVLWYPLLIIFLILFYRKTAFTKRIVLLLVLAISPVITQKLISFKVNKTLNSAAIANSNLRNYFYRKLISYNEGVSFKAFDFTADSLHEQQKIAIASTGEGEIIHYIITHPLSAMAVFYNNLEDNIRSGHPYIYREKNPDIWKWTQNLNDKFFFIHLLFCGIGLFYFILNYASRRTSIYQLILFLYLLNYYILFTSGLVFWAGDRLIVPAQAIWMILYPLLSWQVYNIYFSTKSEAH